MESPANKTIAKSAERVKWALKHLKPHPKQASLFAEASEAEIAELAEDIKRHGLREPIEVLPNGFIISGHQRYRALMLLGKSHADVLIRHDLADADEAVIEAEIIRPNLHRRQMHPLDRMGVAMRLIEAERRKPKGSLLDAVDVRDRVGKLVGVSGRTLSRYLRVLKTPVEVQQAFKDRRISLVVAESVADRTPKERQQIASLIKEGQTAAAAIAKFTPPKSTKHVKPRDALASFAKNLSRGLADLAGRTERLSADAVVRHKKVLRRSRKLIRELLNRLPQEMEP